MSSARSFGSAFSTRAARSVNPNPTRKMPKATAKAPSACPLCPVRIKAGQRVAMDFETSEWAHMGCMVRKLSQRYDELKVQAAMRA